MSMAVGATDVMADAHASAVERRGIKAFDDMKCSNLCMTAVTATDAAHDPHSLLLIRRTCSLLLIWKEPAEDVSTK